MSGHTSVLPRFFCSSSRLPFLLFFPFFARKFQTKCHFKSRTQIQLPKVISSPKTGVDAQPEILNVYYNYVESRRLLDIDNYYSCGF